MFYKTINVEVPIYKLNGFESVLVGYETIERKVPDINRLMKTPDRELSNYDLAQKINYMNSDFIIE